MQRAAAAFRAIDRNGVPFDERRGEERKALDVIPVRMPEENVRVNGLLPLAHQSGAQLTRAGAAVKNQKVAVGRRQLDAGGIAAEVVCGRPGTGDRASCPPETYSHELHLRRLGSHRSGTSISLSSVCPSGARPRSEALYACGRRGLCALAHG